MPVLMTNERVYGDIIALARMNGVPLGTILEAAMMTLNALPESLRCDYISCASKSDIDVTNLLEEISREGE